jgi:dephospho-CoA kinase
MKRMIQLRGSNGYGKTTAVSQFVLKHGMKPENIECNGLTYELQTDGHGTYVLAKKRKDGTYSGLDGTVNNRNDLINLITKLIAERQPEVIVFEGLIYGLTFKLGFDLNNLAKKNGYKFTAVCLTIPRDTAIERIYKRNGGKPFNQDAFDGRCKSNLKAYERLRDNGIDTRLVDTSRIQYKDMYKVIEGVL